MVRIESCAISSISHDLHTCALQQLTNHQLNIQQSSSISKDRFQQKDSDKSYFGTCSRDRYEMKFRSGNIIHTAAVHRLKQNINGNID